MSVISLGIAFDDLAYDQAIWSQQTFGLDSVRGPIGSLKHLEKEAREAQQSPDDVMEYADCLLLIPDASRRAGFDLRALVRAAIEKMKINKTRTWPKPIGDVPSEHVR